MKTIKAFTNPVFAALLATPLADGEFLEGQGIRLWLAWEHFDFLGMLQLVLSVVKIPDL